MFVFAVFGQIYQMDQSNTNSNTNIPLFHAVIDQKQIQIHKKIKEKRVFKNNYKYVYDLKCDDDLV